MLRRTKLFLGIFLVFLLSPIGMASAQYTSPSYRVDETFFGAGGELSDISPSYQAKVAAGELGVEHTNDPITFIQGGQNFSAVAGSTLSVSYPSNVTAGDLLVVSVYDAKSTGSGVSVTDSTSLTWTKATDHAGVPGSSPSEYGAIYYAQATSNTAMTLTYNTPPSSDFRRIVIHEYKGASALDATSTNSGISTTVDSGSATTHFSNELIFGWMISENGVTSPGSGYTLRETAGSESTMDKTVSTAGSYQVTAPTSPSTGWMGLMATFYQGSGGYQAYSGFNTTDRPILEVAVTGGTFNMGVLTTSAAKAISTAFTVRNYLSSGYTVQVGGTPPKNNTHALNNMASAVASSPGTEQFGINLAANTLPTVGAFGSDPVQIPDTSFGFGVANSSYNTTNIFKYVENDIVAHSNSSSGVTQYTMSAIANISTTTPGGSYGTSLFVNVVSTF
jgi:hypothetical protein